MCYTRKQLYAMFIPIFHNGFRKFLSCQIFGLPISDICKIKILDWCFISNTV